MVKVSNINARGFVTGCVEFKGSHIFGRWEGKSVYVVYSYGLHFPMYAKIRGAWYANKDKYSVSTSRQQSQCGPGGIIVEELPTEALQRKIAYGVAYEKDESEVSHG